MLQALSKAPFWQEEAQKVPELLNQPTDYFVVSKISVMPSSIVAAIESKCWTNSCTSKASSLEQLIFVPVAGTIYSNLIDLRCQKLEKRSKLFVKVAQSSFFESKTEACMLLLRPILSTVRSELPSQQFRWLLRRIVCGCWIRATLCIGCTAKIGRQIAPDLPIDQKKLRQ